MDKLKMHSINKVDENIKKIGEMFPNCITERKNDKGEIEYAVDFDVLKQELSSVIVEGNEERYQFTWPDKKNSILRANSPIAKTLRPCREESVDFDNTENLYIEGDNLDVLKLLQETYLGKIKMIYIDPPYNTGNDFVYNDDFAESADEYLANSGQFDEEGNRLIQNTESNGRFHTEWLNMIYSRIKLAKDLLTADGVLFISIDDNEIENLRKICDEILGECNFVAQFIWKKKQGGGNDSSFVVAEHEYVLCFAKNINMFSLGLDKNYKLDDALYPFSDEKGDYGLITLDKTSIQFSQSLVFEIIGPDGKKYLPRIVKGKQSCWRWSKNKVEKQYSDLVFKNDKVYTKYYRPEGVTPRSLLVDSVYGRTESGNDDIKSLFQPNPFSYPKPILLIKHLVSIGTKKEDYILDFFSGSATTAHAVMQLNVEDGGNRKFIMVQLPEETAEKSEAYKAGYKNICEIGKERIRRAGAKIKKDSPMTTANIDTGFRVLKLDSTNMKDVYYNPAEYDFSLFETLADNIKEDRTPEDLLFQVMLDLGVLLSSKIEESTIAGKKVFNVAGNYLIACFDDNVTEETIKAIAQQEPYYFVMRDSSMASDSVATNFEQIFATYSPDTVRKVL
ncbi:MAG: site-specific DNA-methyltransferase [Acutalibacteraceae bacterium]|nr:site-specific DNA-methyltransferase [Acutalibacteraceae bacterium]